MAATTQFFYDPRLLTDRDWVRYYIGDTKRDYAEVDDRELDALLADEDAPTVDPETGDAPTAAQWRGYRKLVASRAAAAIAARYAREADVSFENQRTSLSAKFVQYRQLADRLAAEATLATTGGWLPTVRW